MTPESIGVPVRQMVLGKHSGRHAFEERLRDMGFTLAPEELEPCFARFKELCDKKKEVTDRDIEALVRDRAPEASGTYVLKGFSVHAGDNEAATAVVTLEKEGTVSEEVALGNGPVDAAYKAVDKIIGPPEYAFENYAIQSVSEGKDTLGEVMATLRCGDRIFVGKGLSTDIIKASILAYVHAQNKLMAYCGAKE
jgi:2-isopropylmalate synthase